MNSDRYRKILQAFAMGDAFGVFFEFSEVQHPVDTNILNSKSGWPIGGVSDDTLLLLLTIQSLSSPTSSISAIKFEDLLRSNLSTLRGLGPTTRFALGLPIKPTEVLEVGITNGALMRLAPIGISFPAAQSNLRREYVSALAQVTHKNSEAVDVAIIGSAIFSDAIENGSLHDVYDVAFEEAKEIGSHLLNKISPNRPHIKVSNGALETLNALISVSRLSETVPASLQIACEFGGDTDTLAALAASLTETRYALTSEFEKIPWFDQLDWGEIIHLHNCAAILADFYEEHSS